MLSAPESFSLQHETASFVSGVNSLDEWLKKRAMQNQLSGASRTVVICQENRVVGYYALASSAISVTAAPGHFKRNMPDPIPVVVLGRLAIAQSHQGQGLGRALFQDAGRRVVNAADAIGIRGLLVHALSIEAKNFYLNLGLHESPLEAMTLMVTVIDLRVALQMT